MVADLVHLLDHLDIKAAHFVGYSMGAEVVLKLATRHPDRVRSLVMGGSGWSGKPELQIYRQLADSLNSSASFGPLLHSLTPSGQPGPTDDEIASLDRLLQGQDIKALVAAASAMDQIIDVSRVELSSTQVPVLGIAGEHDPEGPNLEKMTGVVPDFTMQTLAGRAHMTAVSDPQYTGAILDFLQGQQSSLRRAASPDTLAS
jgi:pimeloyl-ACP methyl ester carboxylesterase